MIGISFEISGRKINPNNIRDALQKALLEEIANNVRNSLNSVRCPEHRNNPKVKIKRKSIDNLSFEVEGCCQSLIGSDFSMLK